VGDLKPFGGPQVGSGRPRLLAARTKRVVVTLSSAELETLTVIAAAWGVPRSTAAYGLLADRLFEARSTGARMPGGLVEAASRVVLEAARVMGQR